MFFIFFSWTITYSDYSILISLSWHSLSWLYHWSLTDMYLYIMHLHSSTCQFFPSDAVADALKGEQRRRIMRILKLETKLDKTGINWNNFEKKKNQASSQAACRKCNIQEERMAGTWNSEQFGCQLEAVQYSLPARSWHPECENVIPRFPRSLFQTKGHTLPTISPQTVL